MKVVILGASGMLGRDLVAECNSRVWQVTAWGRAELDLATEFELPSDLRADVIFNCAAYTAVDRAESDFEVALQVNGRGVARLAKQCLDRKIRLVHFSTDYVFDGTASEPYGESDPVNPRSAYGKSKLEGERAALELGATVLRTAWLFGPQGNCFPKSILRAALDGKPLRVVSDQLGCPTYTPDLAWVAAEMVAQGLAAGLYHAVSPEPMSWHAFASKVVGSYFKLHNKPLVEIAPIASSEWPTPAPRPAYSVLSIEKLRKAGIEWPRTTNEAIQHFVSHAEGISDV
jgi:dTDP-4-dehydrorhamnose reductase